jgi:hypothetical protein
MNTFLENVLKIYHHADLMVCTSIIIFKKNLKIMLLHLCLAKVTIQSAAVSSALYQTLVFFIYTCGKKQ